MYLSSPEQNKTTRGRHIVMTGVMRSLTKVILRDRLGLLLSLDGFLTDALLLHSGQNRSEPDARSAWILAVDRIQDSWNK